MANSEKDASPKFDFKFTQDGSVGLYNSEVQDVYHSVYGAMSEGWEKFVLPLDFEKNFAHKKNLRVLDICYGIGYNTKALLKKMILSNYRGDVFIDALEYDKNLVLISPFVKDGYFKNYPEVAYTIFENLLGTYKTEKEVMNTVLNSSKTQLFFEPFYRRFIKRLRPDIYTCNPLQLKRAFVHNIYYHCISTRKKKGVRGLRFNNFKITPHFKDARETIKSLSGQYDIIFLDAFTPTKLPTLWTLDFFKELFRLSGDSTLLVTYSNSAAVRHAMLDAGFYVGKLFDKTGRHCGTIASTKQDMIHTHLDNYDIGLMQTNAGVYFRDENLKFTAEEIMNEYAERKKSLSLESSSQYIKRFRSNKESKNV